MATVREALQAISRNCDGAISQDGVGFNGVDTGFAKTLLTKTTWTPKMELAAHKILKKYRKQLLNNDINYDTLELMEQTPKKEENLLDLHFNGNLFVINSSYSEKDFIKSTFPNRHWDTTTKTWTFDPTVLFMAKAIEYKDKFTSISEEARSELNTLYIQARKDGLVNPTEPQEPTEKQEQASGANQDFSAVKSYIKSEYLPHQRRAFESAISHPNFALFLEQRAGKTYPTIGAIGYRADTAGIRRILIVAPKTVIYEWQEKIEEEADYPVEVHLLDDSLDDRRQALKGLHNPKNLQIVLTNYDAIRRLQSDLISWKPEMIILDEAHHIKNGKAQQSKAAFAIGKVAKFRMILTGTPISQSPLDIWSQYRFLDNTIFDKSYIRFRDRYAVMGGYMGKQIIGLKTVPTIQGVKNIHYDEELSKEFTEKVYSIAMRVTLDEVNNSPKPLITYKYAELENSARKIYDHMEEEAFLEVDSGRVTAPIVLTKLLRMQQICGGFIRADESENYQQVSSAKLNALEEVIIGLEGKAVIFAKFIPEIEAIRALAEKHHIQHHILTGKTKNRGQIKKDFQSNPDTKLFIAQIGTGGEGITLSAADITIFFSTGLSLLEYDQAKSRIKNLTKTHQLHYIHILAKNTRDEDIVDTLDRKQDIAKMSVDKLRKMIFKEENTMPLPREVEKVLENQPRGGERFDSEVKNLLDDIEKDLEAYGKKEHKPERSNEEFFEEQRKKKQAEESVKNQKKVEKVKAKEEKIEQRQEKSEKIVTLQDLGQEMKMDPKEMRKVLRSKFQKPEGGRWEWNKGDPELDKIRKALKGL
jgi:SNF2 family DNA or RNA helicase